MHKLKNTFSRITNGYSKIYFPALCNKKTLCRGNRCCINNIRGVIII